MYVERDIEERSWIYFWLWKSINITYSEYVFRLGVSSKQRACAILLSGACPAVQKFHTLCLTQRGFGKKILDVNMGSDFLYKVYLKHFLLYWNWVRSDKNVNCCYCKVPILLWVLSENWILWADFRKIYKYHTSWKSVRWKPSCSMWTEVQTDRDYEANSHFPKFCERA